MPKKHKIPIKEATGEKNLEGNYLITFKLKNISEQDHIIITDIIEGIARSLEGTSAISKISNFDIEKIDITGESLQKPLKVGDLVRLKRAVKITTQFSEKDGIYVVGSKDTEAVDTNFLLTENNQAIINSIKEDQAELIDFDSTVTVSVIDSETGLPEEVQANIESVKIPLLALEKVEE